MAELSQFQNYGKGLMSIDPLVELKFSFKTTPTPNSSQGAIAENLISTF